MSQLVQNESVVTHAPARLRELNGSLIKPAIPLWQVAILAALSLWLYVPTIYHLASQWKTDPDFTHGFFVPLFSAFVIWQERGRLSQIARKPSWWGLAITTFALGMLIVGRLGVELFLARASMLFLIAGVVVLFLGWNFFRAIFFPWAFLWLMIPIPALVFNQITFPLQLLASRLAANVLPLFGIPVLRQGNLLTLPNLRALDVAEACSGVRSLMMLAFLAIVYGYLMERRIAVRWALALIALPIAVAANSTRIVGTGLVEELWNPEMAHGFYHTFEGLIIFVVCLVLLYFAHFLIRRIWPDRGTTSFSDSPKILTNTTLTDSWPRFVLAVLLFASAAAYLQAHARNEVFPPRLPLQSFPAELGPWSGTDQPIDQETLDKLGPGEFLSRGYSGQADQASSVASPAIDLLIAYFPSQSNGDSIHSPMHCLPGAGWQPIANTRVTLSFPGHEPFPANRVLIRQGEVRQLVLYWYWSHDRGVASEYRAKYQLVRDSMKLHRSDGALVRITTPIYPGENADSAYQRILPFAAQTVPLLNDYIPR